MKRIISLIALVTIFISCNNGNEGSDSIYADSVRIKDSTLLVDSVDNVGAMQEIDTLQPVVADTTMR